jgi:PhoPQ-activated pathogenicity-related protein
MKFRIIAIVLVVVVLATTIVALWIQPASVHIADSSKPADLKLLARHSVEKVTTLHVEGRGKIDGAGEFTLLLNGQPYKTERVNGPVKFTWRVDWYSPDAVVRYTPLTARSGSITLRYHFAGP